MYYRLTYITSSAKERRGDSFLNGAKPLTIGQGEACHVQLPESDAYEPQTFATILPDEEGRGWLLVRRTDTCRISANGADVQIAHRLHHGDLLAFAAGEVKAALRFELFDDGEYDAKVGIIYKKRPESRHAVTAAILCALLALVVAAYALFFANPKELRRTDWTLYDHSIYQLTVDSVYLLADTVTADGCRTHAIVEAIELHNLFVGTAFLTIDRQTGDTLFVTARHCVEPWINDEQWDGLSPRATMSPEVRMATTAETENRYAGYDKYLLRAHCVLNRGLERYDYYSTDFCMNKSRDLVMRLGSPDEPVYWRTIFPIAKRRDMELGDFAYVRARCLSRQMVEPIVPLAEWEEVVSFTKNGNRDIAVLGFPLNDNNADRATVVYGNYMDVAMEQQVTAPDGCLKLYAPINRGNSGGPVFALTGSEVKVIGIVSKADSRADQGLFWSVPITEVACMHRQGDQIEETETYRR